MAVTSLRRLAAAGEGVPGVRDVVRLGLGKVFGPPPFDPQRDPGDPGLYGPGSASWRVIGEPAAIVGGVRALLVQLMHPLAMAGVADHSAFREDPLGRLHRTSAYVTATTFGSTSEALAVARVVRTAHRPVKGRAPDTRRYAAGDPDLLTWVQLALTSSFLATDRHYAPRPLDEDAADAFVAEQSRAAALLDPRVDLDALAADESALAALRAGTLPLPMLEEGRLPQTAAALTAAICARQDDLVLNHQGREAVRFLLKPPLAPPILAGYLPMLTGALGSLEPWQRRVLGLPSSDLLAAPVRLQTRALLAGFRFTTGMSPSVDAARRRAAA